MTRAVQLALASAAVLVPTAGQVQAAIIQVDFDAEVTFVHNSPVLGISPSLGDLVSGTFVYNTDAVDADPGDPSRGIYFSGSSLLTINGHTLASSGPSIQVVFDNGPPFNDLFGLQNGVSQGTSPILVDGVLTNNARFGFGFTQPSGGLTSDSLPTLADLSTLDVGQFQIVQEDKNGVILFNNLTSFSATDISTVPEPSSLALFGIGACVAGVGAACRRRRKKCQEATA